MKILEKKKKIKHFAWFSHTDFNYLPVFLEVTLILQIEIKTRSVYNIPKYDMK